MLFSNSSWKVRVMPKVFKMFICSFIIWMDWPPSSMKFLVVSHPLGRFNSASIIWYSLSLMVIPLSVPPRAVPTNSGTALSNMRVRTIPPASSTPGTPHPTARRSGRPGRPEGSERPGRSAPQRTAWKGSVTSWMPGVDEKTVGASRGSSGYRSGAWSVRPCRPGGCGSCRSGNVPKYLPFGLFFVRPM